MKKKLPTILLIVVFLIGLSLVLYPTVSNYLKTLAYHRAIDDFRSTVAAIDDETYEDILTDALARNQKLLARGNVRATLTDEELAEYDSLLRIDETGIMGYVVIPKLDLSLPIYHGTDDAVLQDGIGHLEGSSLPIGGEGTHAILSGHRGLPSSKLFTNIDQLEVGDTFTVRVLRGVLTYRVDKIQTVLPNEVNALQIVEGEDYCTLLTCTPYGVNSHRLLVRGRRIPTPSGEDAEVFDTLISEQNKADDRLPITVVAIAGILGLALILIIVFVRRRKRRGA